MNERADEGEWGGRRVTLMGLGRFGGGVGATRFLARHGARVLVTDLATPDRLDRSLESIRDLIDSGAVSVRLGEHDQEDFQDCDLVVVSPAVPRPWENPLLQCARSRGIEMTTEIGLLMERLPARRRVIGVTGTAGKSTTAAMIAHVIGALGRPVHLGGNIGGSLLDDLDRIAAEDWVVLELSSAQLYWLDRRFGQGGGGRGGEGGWGGGAPGVAAVTNLSPNHLDWHGSIDHYEASKLAIARNQRPGSGDVLVLDTRTIARPDAWTGAARGRLIDLGSSAAAHVDEPRLGVPGAHNRRNARMAIAVVEAALGIDRADAMAPLESFAGLPHRLCLVCERGGVRFYDDSKSTTPESAAAAIDAISERTDPGAIHLIAGGFDKGVDLGPMVQSAARCGSVQTIGQTGAALARAVRGAGGRSECCGDLESAVARAADSARVGGVVLLSPGCASWDQFDSFEQRGRRFAQLVRSLVASSGSGP